MTKWIWKLEREPRGLAIILLYCAVAFAFWGTFVLLAHLLFPA